jgi:hypothetical protein
MPAPLSWKRYDDRCEPFAKPSATIIKPALLTCAERIQYDGFLRRQEDNQIIKDLAKNNASIKEITRRTGRSADSDEAGHAFQ